MNNICKEYSQKYSNIRYTLADSSTDTKTDRKGPKWKEKKKCVMCHGTGVTCHVLCVMCHVSCFMSHVSPVARRMSPVTCHLH